MPKATEQLIEALALQPHPEGGFYRETYRSAHHFVPDGYPSPRAACTSILFLLPHGGSSRAHRVRSDELWLHHSGDPLRLILTDPEGNCHRYELGAGTCFQVLVPGGWIQEAHADVDGPAGYGLVACIVSPGFVFEDFELL